MRSRGCIPEGKQSITRNVHSRIVSKPDKHGMNAAEQLALDRHRREQARLDAAAAAEPRPPAPRWTLGDLAGHLLDQLRPTLPAGHLHWRTRSRAS